MTTTPMARMVDTVRVNCPGAMDGVVRLELYNTLSEFFQRTNLWVFELLVEIESGTNDYLVDTGQNVVVNRLMGLARPDQPPFLPLVYAPMDPPQYLVDANIPAQPEVHNPIYRVPREGMLLNAGTPNPIIRIVFNPGKEIWVATLALNVSDPMDADGLPVVPQWIVEKYKDAISSGTISRMMTQGGKPYSNEKGAAFHGRKFNQGVGLARQEARSMFTYGGQRWAFPQGWKFNHPRFY